MLRNEGTIYFGGAQTRRNNPINNRSLKADCSLFDFFLVVVNQKQRFLLSLKPFFKLRYFLMTKQSSHNSVLTHLNSKLLSMWHRNSCVMSKLLFTLVSSSFRLSMWVLVLSLCYKRAKSMVRFNVVFYRLQSNFSLHSLPKLLWKKWGWRQRQHAFSYVSF